MIQTDVVRHGRGGLLRGCAWAFAALVAGIGAGLAFASEAMAKLVLLPVETLRSDAFLAELKTGGLPPEQIAEFTEQVTTLRDALAVVYPGLLVILAAVLVAVNAAVLRLYLLRRDPGWLEDGEFEAMDKQVHEEVDDAMVFAEESPDPDPGELFTDVYKA